MREKELNMEEKENLGIVSFSFYPTDHEYYHDTYLSFSVHDDMSLQEIHRLCKRFVVALGFDEDAVDDIFGEDCD